MNIIQSNIIKLKELCFKHHVSKLFVFGSILNSKFSDLSDIDFIVDFKKMEYHDYADNYFDLKKSLENLFHRNIDLLEEKAITNPYFKKNIDKQKQLVYGY